jgi:TRAP-type mannitol/chloroaromatic compound transport system substrate-binding protein
VLTPPAEVFPAMAAGTVDAAEFIGPWNDQAFGLYRVAKYYYQPGWHEVGPTAELLVNRRAWESLPTDLRALAARDPPRCDRHQASAGLSRRVRVPLQSPP